MKRLVDISESLIEGGDADRAVMEVIAGWQKRNECLNVTEALIFTDKNFAQILEGPHLAVDELMVSICNDTRHHEINILDQSPILLRRFANWRMA